MRQGPLVLVAALLGATGCWRTHGDPITHTDGDGDIDGDVDSDGDTDSDADGDTDADGDSDAGSSNVHPLDLLFLVDNSNSMAQEQASLAEAFPLMIDALLHPPDSNGNGITDFRRVQDLHVGVISTDMGTGGFAVQTCRDAIDGDDGILRNTPSDVIHSCEDTYDSFLSFQRGDDPAALAHDFACIATLGTGGCGFEQQLKAIREAVTVHAAGANEGFLRDDSVLAIVIVTDEEDCSIREDIPDANDIFNTGLDLGALNLRCYNYRDQYVEPVESYFQSLLEVRADHPERLVLASIVGVPPANDCGQDTRCLLDLPEMQETIDNSAEGAGERLTPSCDEAGLGEAFPPRRFVTLSQALDEAGAGVAVHSICTDDWTSTMANIARTIGLRLND